LHERDAFATQIDILGNYRASPAGGLAHCFTGCRDQLREYLDLGFHIGITGWVCDPRRGQALRDAVSYIPPDRLILETDAPYLIPRHLDKKQLAVPQRRRNEPCLLPVIARFVADLLDCPVARLSRQTSDNARRLFRLQAQ
jgi:TatD DNase family protein